jgi:FkbM family methyltransferase
VLAKTNKLARIAAAPGLWWYACHGIAPAIEHLAVMADLEISTFIDVGANIGQFSALIAYLHPRAEIFAFEPMPAACRRYRSAFPESRVRLFEMGIGHAGGVQQLHITNRTDSSSLLKPGIRQEKAFGVHEIATLSVPVRQLSDVLIMDDISRPCLMKIDVQGAELDVLAGAARILDNVDFIYLELSFVELYEGQPHATEVLKYLFGVGYLLQGVYNQTSTKAFGPTQADFLLARKATFV